MKNKVINLILFTVAILVGGTLGYELLSGSKPLNILLFFLSCIALGQVFSFIQKLLMNKNKK